MNKPIAGWDIGGAHVKLALLDASGQIIAVAQQACPLWKGVDYLHRTLTEFAGQFDLHLSPLESADGVIKKRNSGQGIVKGYHG